MPKEPNKFLRLIVPLGVALIGIGVVIAVSTNTKRQTGPQPPTTTSPAATGPVAATGPTAPTSPAAAQPAPTAPPPAATGATTAAATPSTPAAAPTQPPAAPDELTAQSFDDTTLTPIGSLDRDGQYEFQIDFSRYGAGIKSIALSRHFETIQRLTPVVIQREHEFTPPGASTAEVVTPLAVLGIEINGKQIPLLYHFDPAAPGGTRPVWKETAPGAFEALIVNASGAPVVRLERRYSLTPNSFSIRLDQKAVNLTSGPMSIRWIQFGPVDLVNDSSGYGGDKRRVRFGYLYPPEFQKADPTVISDEFHYSRSSILGRETNGVYDEVKPIWPNRISMRDGFRHVWVGMSNRYFGAAMFPIVSAGAGPDAKVFHEAEAVDRVLLRNLPGYDPILILRTTSAAQSLAPSAEADLSMAVYTGPMERPEIRRDDLAGPVGLDGLVLYNFGGPCALCTFAFLTSWLLGLLRFLHASIVFDWALSIMVLVLIVRTILHPVTKWSQIRLQRFGKQMQGMAPKQKKLQEKYGGDPKKMREEMAKLWREEGISPTGALGCIPMFLQMPVWIALYAMLYFAFELRHQPAFFGVFQALIPGNPKFMGYFLGDLAQPDRFYYFGHDFHIPLLSSLLGPISSINILPVILGVVFYIQQKYLTPPSTTPLTPEQEQQQKMMKWMMVFLFPLFMYNAPSGLALYFIVNSTLGILESRYIRAHITKHDLLKPTGPRTPKPGGFMARLQKLAEERQKQMLKARGQSPPRKKV